MGKVRGLGRSIAIATMIVFGTNTAIAAPMFVKPAHAVARVNVSVAQSGPTSVARPTHGSPATATYIITVQNQGPLSAENVRIYDILPFGLVAQKASNPACALQGPLVDCNLGSMKPRSSTVIVITAAVKPMPVCKTMNIQNNVYAWSSSPDQNYADNQSVLKLSVTCDTVAAQCSDGKDNDGDGKIDFPQDLGCASATDNDEFNLVEADLAITKTGPATVTPGSDITYALTVSNRGPSAATNVRMQDLLPAGVQYISTSVLPSPTVNNSSNNARCEALKNVVRCSVGTFAANGSLTFNITVRVPETGVCRPTVLRNVATVTSSVRDPSFLNNTSPTVQTMLVCPSSSSSQTSSSSLSSTSSVSSISSAPVPCLPRMNGMAATCSSSSSSSSSQPLPVTQCSDGIDNDTDGNIDFPADKGCNSEYDQNEADGLTDISVSAIGPQSAMPGSNVTYMISVTNNGPDMVTTPIAIRDTIPYGLTYVSEDMSNCAVVGSAVRCATNRLGVGQTKVFKLTFNIPSSMLCGNGIVIRNEVVASETPQGDQIQNNNRSEAVTLLTCPPRTTDLAMTMAGPATAQKGSTVVYTLTVTNNGPNAASLPISINDQIPDGLLYVDAQSDAACDPYLNANVRCGNITLANGQSRSFQLTFNVESSNDLCGKTILNRAAISENPQDDPNSGNNAASVSTQITCPAPHCSDGIDNDGDGSADFPADFSCASATDNDENDSMSQCQDTLDNDGDGDTDLNDPGCSGKQDNNESDDERRPDVSIDISAPASIERGQMIAYLITIKNNGPSKATHVHALDTVPNGLTFVRAQSDINCIVDTKFVPNRIDCSAGTVASGEERTFTIVYQTSPTLACGSGITHRTGIFMWEKDPKTQNNADAATTTVTCPVVAPACNDTLDNDADGKADFPHDLGCLTANDTNETDGSNVVIAEFVYRTVEINGGVLNTLPASPSFDDVPASAWYYGHFEDAGKEGWIRGDNNCYGTHPCFARPTHEITRAEAAAIAVRAFGFEPNGYSPAFSDNPAGPYQQFIQIAADYCVLLADTQGAIRPNDTIALDELSAMFKRIDENQTYGVHCGVIQEAATLDISMKGPAQIYTPDTNDAVLAKTVFTVNRPVIAKDLFIAIEAMDEKGRGLGATNGASFDNIHEVLEDFEMRNLASGLTINGVRLTTTESFDTNAQKTYQIYRFDDVPFADASGWEMRADFIDNGSANSPKNLDRFRVHICTQPIGTTTGCTFGGLIPSTTSYDIWAVDKGNEKTVENITPGGTVTGNFHTIAIGGLDVAVKSIGSSGTAVKNMKNITFLRFEARAHEANDVLLAQAIFTATAGSVLNVQNYTFWVDTDNDSSVDMILQGNVAAANGRVTFNNLTGGGYVIPKEQSVIFEVHADISSSLTNNQLQLAFDTASTNYIEAEDASDGSAIDGISTNGACNEQADFCNIFVTTTPSKLWNLVNQGNLFVTRDSSPVRNRQLLGGTLGESIMRLQFRAQNEDIDVTDLQFTSIGNRATSIDRLELYKDGSTTPFATATIGGCGSDQVTTTHNGVPVSTFCSNTESRQLVVKDGTNLDVIVRPKMKTDDQGAISDEDIQLFLSGEAVSNNATGEGAVRARGAESSNDLVANNGNGTAEGEIFIGTDVIGANADIIGKTNDVVLSKITSITNANPDADGSYIPTGIGPIGQFRFTAAVNNNTLNATNKVRFTDMIFTVKAQNVQMDENAFKIYNKSEASLKTPCHILDSSITSPTIYVACWDMWMGGMDTDIDSGGSHTFVLEAQIQNPNVSGNTESSLQVSLDQFTDRTVEGMASNLNHLRWIDLDFSSPLQDFWWIEYPDTQVNSTHYRG